MAVECYGWAARDTSGVLSPYKFSRRAVGPDDVCFKVTHCGVCHAEIVWLFNGLGDTKYPIVPGHEIVGVVTQVGSNVKRFKVGDHVGVGPHCRACTGCDECNNNDLEVCEKIVLTYNYEDIDGTITKGGFCDKMVVHEDYAYNIPDKLPLKYAGPLLCAGVTVYGPMMQYGINKPGKHLGVIGLGGLGHMAVKFGKAFGVKVTVLSTSPSKKDEALNALGADNFLVTTDPEALKAAAKTMDLIVDTASGDHPLNLYLPLLKACGALAMVGLPRSSTFAPFLLMGKRSISGSFVTPLKDVQKMLDFCAEHQVFPQIEMISMDYVNTAIERLKKNDVRYRFVIDIENTLHPKA